MNHGFGRAARRHFDAMTREQRAQPRERLALPLKLSGGGRAVTRDVSASGLYFQLEGPYRLGHLVDFELELAHAHMKFTAIGQLVRIDRLGPVTGVAVKLLNPRLTSTD
jgi:hypothetical protein